MLLGCCFVLNSSIVGLIGLPLPPYHDDVTNCHDRSSTQLPVRVTTKLPRQQQQLVSLALTTFSNFQDF